MGIPVPQAVPQNFEDDLDSGSTWIFDFVFANHVPSRPGRASPS